jgi:hypothetical protein
LHWHCLPNGQLRRASDARRVANCVQSQAISGDWQIATPRAKMSRPPHDSAATASVILDL